MKNLKHLFVGVFALLVMYACTQEAMEELVPVSTAMEEGKGSRQTVNPTTANMSIFDMYDINIYYDDGNHITLTEELLTDYYTCAFNLPNGAPLNFSLGQIPSEAGGYAPVLETTGVPGNDVSSFGLENLGNNVYRLSTAYPVSCKSKCGEGCRQVKTLTRIKCEADEDCEGTCAQVIGPLENLEDFAHDRILEGYQEGCVQ